MAFLYFYIMIFVLGEVSPINGFSLAHLKWNAELSSSSIGSLKDSQQSQLDAAFVLEGRTSALYHLGEGESQISSVISESEFLSSYLSDFLVKRRFYDLSWEGKYTFHFIKMESMLFQRIYQVHGSWVLQDKDRTDFLNQGHRTVSEMSFSHSVQGLEASLWLQWRRDEHYGLWDASFYTEQPRVGFEVHVPINDSKSFIYIINHQKLNFLNQLLDQYRTQFVLIFLHQESNCVYDASFIYDYRESSKIRNNLILGQEHSLTINLRARQYWTHHLWFSCYYNHAAHIGDYPIGRSEGIHQIGVSVDWMLSSSFPKFIFRRQVFDDVFDQIMD
ncbi:MAG: hypothetical protein AB8C84_06250 [Oligoflexales bacterium]